MAIDLDQTVLKPSRVTHTGSSFQIPLVRYYLLLLIFLAFALRLVAVDRLPFSLSLDEAVNGLDALQLWRLRWLTPFLQNNFGRETLFFYLQGLALQIYGVSIFTLRWPAVLAGTLAIPLLYGVGKQLQLDRLSPGVSSRAGSSMIALLAATGLAVSYWHLYFSRQGLRANLFLPILLTLVWYFWRGWLAKPSERKRWTWFGLAGLLLGLSFYTYLAARLLPFLFGVFILAEGVRQKSWLRDQWGPLILFGISALGVVFPLGLYFYQNPQALAGRTQVISIFTTDQPLATFFNNGLALLYLHFWGNAWLERWPALNLLASVGLLFGLITCTYRFRQPAALFLLAWWGLGNLPILLSIQDWGGQTTLLRGITAWPATFLIAGVGLMTVGRFISFRTGVRNEFCIPGWDTSRLLLGLFLILGGATTLYSYFVVWPTLAERASDHPPYIARYLNQQQDQFSLVPLTFYSETVTHFLLQEQYPHLENLSVAKWEELRHSRRPGVYLLPYRERAADRFALLVPAKTGPGRAYLLPPLSPGQVEKLATAGEAAAPLAPVLDSEQELIARVYPLGAETPLVAAISESLETGPARNQVVEAEFDRTIRLESYQLHPPQIKPGETVTLTLTWQARRPVDGDYNLFIHLFGVGQEQRYGQVNLPLTGILFEAHRWPVGLRVPDIHRFTLPVEAPEGLYRFEIGLYHAASQQRLPAHLPSADPMPVEDDKVILGTLRVQQEPLAPPRIPLIGVHFGEAITLAGVDLPEAPVSAGQTITYTLHWQATADISQSFTVFTHLLDNEGNLRAQQDNIPQQGRYPTSGWKRGDQVLDPYNLTLPSNLEPGPYTLRVGLYYPETGQRLRLQNSPQDFVDLPASITIQP